MSSTNKFLLNEGKMPAINFVDRPFIELQPDILPAVQLPENVKKYRYNQGRRGEVEKTDGIKATKVKATFRRRIKEIWQKTPEEALGLICPDELSANLLELICKLAKKCQDPVKAVEAVRAEVPVGGKAKPKHFKTAVEALPEDARHTKRPAEDDESKKRSKKR